jgi:hypothetical protein
MTAQEAQHTMRAIKAAYVTLEIAQEHAIGLVLTLENAAHFGAPSNGAMVSKLAKAYRLEFGSDFLLSQEGCREECKEIGLPAFAS